MSTNKKLVKAAAIAAAAGIFATVFALRLPADSTETSGLSRALPVRTATVKIENGYHARRTFTGRAVPGRVSSMAFELGGTVSEIKVDLGSHVKAGDVLAELDTARLKAQRAQLMAEKDEVAASLDLAERTLKRAQETFQNGHTSAQRLDEAEANAISLRARAKRLEAGIAALDVDVAKSEMRAPFDGVITARLVDEGVVVGAGARLLELSEDSRMEAHIGMPPEYALAVEDGAKVELRGGRRQQIDGATVRAVVPTIEGQTRTMMVTFDLPEAQASRGELITAVVNDWQETTGTWLPIRALSSDVRGLWRVYKVEDGGDGPHVRFENVQVLYTDTNRVFVSGTISDGDLIIADGVERLAPGQRVTVLADNPAPRG
ncbi:efflux RND transporter periplasmic adaptor subunit [Kordiimonas gwangyangensis]|uniref:efflux RND transporter periplasmic adaptor subunit n=1 Tax=Kordiimonas gwangyangensis TaxID=288022 RepID=UPI00035EC47F|nr:efflux RND transporter periplasmic adaptor subunit [Kordiimonas gwangyangensis]